MYPLGFGEVDDADDPISLSQDTEFIQPTSFTSGVLSSTSRSETAHSDSNKHSRFKTLCACLFATVFFATGAGVGVYFYLRDDHVTTTTTSTPWATSTATRTPSFEVTVVPDITTQANVIVETSQAPTETTTTVATTEQATSVQRDISAIQHDIELNVLCRGVKFIELP
jgi:hypothetical protein